MGVSGASGTPYAAAVLRGLLEADLPVDLIVSRAARLTILDETGNAFRDAHWKDDLGAWLGADVDLAGADLTYWPAGDLAGGPSSGSYPSRGMVVVPASTAACAGIAATLRHYLRGEAESQVPIWRMIEGMRATRAAGVS